MNTKTAKTLTDIAHRIFGIESLETRRSDSLDFRDIAVWNIKAALEAAYLAGQASAARSAK